MARRLTQKQETFCRKYFEIGNATEAALIAGYSPHTARYIASENLTKPNISERLYELNQLAEDASVAKVIERKQILTEIMRGRFADFMTNLTTAKLRSAALQELKIVEVTYGRGDEAVEKKTTTVRLNNPIQAIDLLNKMEKLYAEGAVVNIDNRKLEIIVQSKTAKKLLTEIVEGTPPHAPDND